MNTGRKRSPQYLISRAAARSICGGCRRVVLDGIDRGLPFRLSPVPVNITGETRALLEERLTYRMILPNGEFARRTAENIRADTANGRPLVLAQHNCTEIGTPDIDYRYVVTVMELVTKLNEDSERVTMNHDRLLVLHQELGALVISEQEEPPF